jgi:hypothetical protein
VRNLISGIAGLVIGGLILIGVVVSMFVGDIQLHVKIIAGVFGVLLVLAGLGYIAVALFTMDWSGKSEDDDDDGPRRKKGKKRRRQEEEDEEDD